MRADSKFFLVREFIKTMGSATRREILDGLGISPTTLGRHLRWGIDSGEFELDKSLKIPGMPGRPQLRYKIKVRASVEVEVDT